MSVWRYTVLVERKLVQPIYRLWRDWIMPAEDGSSCLGLQLPPIDMPFPFTRYGFIVLNGGRVQAKGYDATTGTPGLVGSGETVARLVRKRSIR
jgi:hypothetical protein